MRHPILYSRIIERKLQDPRVKIVSLQTFTNWSTDEPADIVAIFRPNTDLAVANGLAHGLIKEGFVNHEFLGKHTVSRGRYGTKDLTRTAASHRAGRAIGLSRTNLRPRPARAGLLLIVSLEASVAFEQPQGRLEGQRLQRWFEGAPPFVPHDVELRKGICQTATLPASRVHP